MFDRGRSVIDATLAAHDGRWFFAVEDDRCADRPGTPFRALRVCSLATATGPVHAVSELVTSPRTEAPCLFPAVGQWLTFFDHFAEGTCGAAIGVGGRD